MFQNHKIKFAIIASFKEKKSKLDFIIPLNKLLSLNLIYWGPFFDGKTSLKCKALHNNQFLFLKW